MGLCIDSFYKSTQGSVFKQIRLEVWMVAAPP